MSRATHYAAVAAVMAAAALGSPTQAQAMGPNCLAEVPPVLGLDFPSRYAGSDATRAQLNPEAEAEAEAALDPVDDFISALVKLVDHDKDRTTVTARADCAMAQLAQWARADALASIDSETAALTLGSRLSGLALVARQAWPHAGRRADKQEVADWLARRVEDQMVFWETASDGAASGNLRAWAALGAAATADVADDPISRGWAAWSTAYVMCSADAEGALPQEMSRAHRAMHYQLHAVAPLVTTAAILKPHGIDLRGRCDGALGRVVDFTLSEVQNGGRGSQQRTGQPQTAVQGKGVRPFQLAWIEPWLSLGADPRADAVAAPLRPLSYSKLGGDLTALWR
ncbi:alginate lyase [Jannaschia pagri]|uniref:Alginate lyase n=1 Tax=Jannaschia pagri TaxID=2829797 RepID=A0ABQ4NIQ2_9RHOB|nr:MULTISPECIES: alginate lyase family protein [unclassified Jannaschia]GIT89609.1 alginate lyase [Jannaschia sp. AI_61]GIT94283.1 alginate lyase [Jannaschia sp. AI_62]